MVWRIDKWDPRSGTGSIKSPHIGPLQFGHKENLDHVCDFRIGEVVEAELEGEAGNYRVVTVFPLRQRAPLGTLLPEFDLINEHDQFSVLKCTSQELVIWVGFCCMRCSPSAVTVHFGGLAEDPGLECGEEYDFNCFRLATEQEIQYASLPVGIGSHAYCFLNRSAGESKNKKIYIVAESIRIASGYNT